MAAHQLPYPWEKQQQTNWCWAGVSKSVADLLGNALGWTQCKIVNAEFGRDDCCGSGVTAACNRPWYLNRALERVTHYNGWDTGKAPYGTVVSEVNRARPVCARILWTQGGGHFLSVFGYDDDEPGTRRIDVADPWWGESVQDYDTFPANYHGGASWTHSYWTR